MKNIPILVFLILATSLLHARFEDDFKKSIWQFKATSENGDVRMIAPLTSNKTIICIKPSPRNPESGGQRCFAEEGDNINNYLFAPPKIQMMETAYAAQMKDPKTLEAFLAKAKIMQLIDQNVPVYSVTLESLGTHPLACKKSENKVDCRIKIGIRDQVIDDGALYYTALESLYKKQNPTTPSAAPKA